jgi:hypothetical protein
MLNRIKCLLRGHKELQDAGSCPFTGKSYKFCPRCQETVEQ